MTNSSSNSPKPVLHHVASLSTLLGYRGKRGELSIPQRTEKIRRAGFDAFAGRVPAVTHEHVAQSGLIFVTTTDMGGLGVIKPKLKAIKATGSRCVNAQTLDHDTPTKRALEVVRRLMDTAGELGMDVSVEMHRDTCTETPEKMYALAEAYERVEKRPLKITWDFSHPAVVKHISPPYWDRLAERPDLIQYANQFHFRPFNGHHAQIPALGRNGNYTPEFLPWLEFAEQVIACWLKAATPGRELFICPEQIPFGYDLSVFGDRWKDVQAIRQAVEQIWRRQLRKRATGRRESGRTGS